VDAPDRLLDETSGDAVWAECEVVDLVEGLRLPIVPLEVQIATMVARQQHERLGAVAQVLGVSDLRVDLLRQALTDRGFDDLSALPEALRPISWTRST
jgi:hypothetical protein